MSERNWGNNRGTEFLCTQLHCFRVRLHHGNIELLWRGNLGLCTEVKDKISVCFATAAVT